MFQEQCNVHTTAVALTTVNRIRMVGLASDVTIMLLFTFYFGHVTNKRDISIDATIYHISPLYFTQLSSFTYIPALVLLNQLQRVIENIWEVVIVPFSAVRLVQSIHYRCLNSRLSPIQTENIQRN